MKRPSGGPVSPSHMSQGREKFAFGAENIFSDAYLGQRWLEYDLKVPRNPTNFAFICTQVGLILEIFLFFVCKKHYFEK